MKTKRLSKEIFQTKSMKFMSTDCGALILVDTGNHEVNRELLTKETEDLLNKEKLIFFPYKYVMKYDIPLEGKKYRIEYNFNNKKTVISYITYTEDEINNTYFIVLPDGQKDFIEYIATNLQQIAPKEFIFGLLLDSVSIRLIPE